MLLHLGPNVITFRTLLDLGQLLHLGLQQRLPATIDFRQYIHTYYPIVLHSYIHIHCNFRFFSPII